ncbi:hypothetical protein [Thermoflexibacter ruber]|uniref:Uncharacterized protein n=1 Tax=Thermoflexibacter ruber TaxID=1003 RepID=A0A1I2FTN8_9BACT|nr:hypothetical protein [Thermoflexibacter ruber]SFF08020.1 hypothetical protein SAMN04488541_101524 [Thermoflexibacter ruber]
MEYNNLKQKHIKRLTKSKTLATEIAPDAVLALFPKIQEEQLFFKKDTVAYWSAPVISSSRGDGHYDTLTGVHLKQGDSCKAMVIVNVMNKKEAHISVKRGYPQPTKIRYKSGRKEILGFPCKRAILYCENKEKNSKWTVEIFYTKKIPNAYFFVRMFAL